MKPETVLNSQNESSLIDLHSDIIYIDGEEASRIKHMIQEKYVEAHHSKEISFLENKNYWRTYVGRPRKEVTRRKKEDLINYLYWYYKGQELSASTIQEVFERSQNYRLSIMNRSENTIERDRQAFEHFFSKQFLQQTITRVTEEIICEYVNKRSKELKMKERALKSSLLILNRVFEYAMKHEKIIQSNPVKCLDIKNYYKNCDNTLKSSDEKIYTVMETEAIKLIIRTEMTSKKYDAVGYAMLFSIETGVRVGEIPPLRWEDITDKGIHIHRQQRMTRIKGKGRTFEELPYTKNERQHPKGGRFFPVTDVIKNILSEIKATQDELGIVSEFIFCNEDGSWLNKETYAQRLRRMCRRMGYEITNNHAFRMSLNSNVFIPLGIHVTERAYLLGHSVEINERYYSHMRTDSLTDLKEILNRSFTQHSRNKLIDFPDNKIPQAQ